VAVVSNRRGSRMRYDLVLRNLRVIDPRNDVDEVTDLGVAGGKIAELGSVGRAESVVDLTGMACIPGVIDIHSHLEQKYLGRAAMADLARGGTTTVLDMAGPLEDVLYNVKHFGCGLNVGIVDAALPGKNLPGQKVERGVIRDFVAKTVSRGAYGVKVLGGHYPFDPDTTHAIFQEANAQGVHASFHVGTTATASNLTGLREAVAMSKDCHMQLCHVQGYLRGAVLGDPLLEVREAMELLQTTENTVTESTLCELANDYATCINGLPESLVVRASLKLMGFEPTEEGLRTGISKGVIRVVLSQGDRMYMVRGEEALRAFERANSNILIMSPVNPRAVGLVCASYKGKDGHFVVDAITADGGNSPRSVQISYGLALVRFGCLTVSELATKLSDNPARIIGIESKGHLGAGADADITVLDLERGKTVMTIVGGNVVMKGDRILGEGGTIITTARGVKNLSDDGFSCVVADPTNGWMYTPRSRRFSASSSQ
jgi:hypothetical protein